MEVVEDRGDFLNQQCSNCDGNLARRWCLDCSEALCGDCVTAHRRVTLTRSHRLLNQPHNDDSLVPPIKFCTLHPLEPLRLFCFTCNLITCRDCQLLAHKNHRFSFVSEAMDSLNQKLDACMHPIRAQMEASRKSLQDMETRLKVLARSELHLTTSLQEVFRSLSELLKVRLERLTREIQTIYDLEREMIKGRMLKVKEMQECQRSVGEAAEKAQNSRDLLVVLRCIEQVASQVKDLMDQDSSPPPNMIYLKVTADRQAVESMFRFGKLLLSWVPFHVSKEFKESVEPPPASTSQPLTSSSTTTSQPLTSSSTTTSQPLTSSSTTTSQPLTSSSTTSQPLTTSSTTTSQPLTSTTKTNNSVNVSSSASRPVSPTNSSSSSSDSSNLLTSFSMTRPQTGTNRDAASNQHRPPFPISSYLNPALACPSAPSEPSSRNGRSSGAESPASAEPSSSGSLSTQVRLHPSSTCPPLSKHNVSQTPTASVSSVCPPSSSLAFVVPPSSSFSSPNVPDPVPTCPIRPSSQSTSGPLGPPLVRSPTNPRFLHLSLDNQGPPPPPPLSLSVYPLVSPLSCVPPASEPPPFHATTTRGSDSIRINVLTKSQLQSGSGLHYRRWITSGKRDVVPSVFSSSSSAGPTSRTSSIHHQNHKAPSSSQTSSSSTQVGHHVSSSYTKVSTSSASVQKDHPNISPSVPWVNTNHPRSVLPPLAGPSPFTLKVAHQSQVLNQLPVPQTSAPLPSSSILVLPLSSTVGAGSTLPPSEGALLLAVVPQTHSQPEKTVSSSCLSAPKAPQRSLLQDLLTSQNSCGGPQSGPVSLRLQAARRCTSDNVLSMEQPCSRPTDQETSTHRICSASNHQLLLDQNPASNGGPGPSHLNDQHQYLHMKVMAGSNHDVLQQDHEVDKTTSVSKPGTAESGETRTEEDASSPETSDIQQTSEVSNPAEEQSPPEDHEVKSPVHPGDIQPYGGLFSPISSESELPATVPEESDPAEEHPIFKDKKSEDIQPYGEPFSPVSSEDHLSIIIPEETKPYSPISSVDETITPEETHPAGQLSTEVQPADAPDEERVGPFSPVSSEDHLSIIVPEETKPSERLETGEFEWATREPEEIESYGRAYSPISSVDEIIPPEETRSTDVQPATNTPYEDRLGLFSPVSSEDHLTIIVPKETKPSERLETGAFEWATGEPEEIESYGRAYSPISSVEEIIPPDETHPAGRLSTEVQPATNTPDDDRVELFSPVSSDDELSSTCTKASDLMLNISETSDSETEAPSSLQTQQRDFNLSLWQPKVSLERLPVSPPEHKRLLPSLEFVLGDDDNTIHLKEPHVSDEDSDVTEDFTKSVSSDSPIFAEVISCCACVSPSASKICCMCGRGYHMDCHVPPVGPDIWSEWICSLCQDLSDPSDPYSSDRPKSLQGAGLGPLDQRRCETLLLHLKVEGCHHFSESALWSDVVQISERLTHLHPPPYQTAAQLVSDLWTLFEDSSQSDELEKLQQSFQKKLKETFGAELPPSLLVAPTSDKAGAEGPSSSVSVTEVPREQEDFKELRKRLRDFLGLKFPSASKRTKRH